MWVDKRVTLISHEEEIIIIFRGIDEHFDVDIYHILNRRKSKFFKYILNIIERRRLYLKEQTKFLSIFFSKRIRHDEIKQNFFIVMVLSFVSLLTMYFQFKEMNEDVS